MFKIIDYIGDEYKEGCVFIFMDSDKDPVLFLNKSVFSAKTDLEENYKLATDMRCDFLCVVVPYSLDQGSELFDSFEGGDDDTIKLLSIEPSLTLKESKGYSLLMIIPISEDSISLTLLKGRSIIYHKTLISQLPIQIGGDNGY